MITIKNESPVKLESALQISAELIEKLSRIPEKVVKHVCKDLHISHITDAPMSKAGVLIDHEIDIEQKCDELKKAHKDFLNWLENYEVDEDKEAEVACEDEDGISPVLKKWAEKLKQVKEEAAEEGVGMCVFLMDRESIVYHGYISDKELVMRIMAINMLEP